MIYYEAKADKSNDWLYLFSIHYTMQYIILGVVEIIQTYIPWLKKNIALFRVCLVSGKVSGKSYTVINYEELQHLHQS